MKKESLKQVLEKTIIYLEEYLEIVDKRDKKSNILFSGKSANINQLIKIFKSELERL